MTKCKILGCNGRPFKMGGFKDIEGIWHSSINSQYCYKHWRLDNLQKKRLQEIT